MINLPAGHSWESHRQAIESVRTQLVQAHFNFPWTGYGRYHAQISFASSLVKHLESPGEIAYSQSNTGISRDAVTKHAQSNRNQATPADNHVAISARPPAPKSYLGSAHRDIASIRDRKPTTEMVEQVSTTERIETPPTGTNLGSAHRDIASIDDRTPRRRCKDWQPVEPDSVIRENDLMDELCQHYIMLEEFWLAEADITQDDVEEMRLADEDDLMEMMHWIHLESLDDVHMNLLGTYISWTEEEEFEWSMAHTCETVEESSTPERIDAPSSTQPSRDGVNVDGSADTRPVPQPAGAGNAVIPHVDSAPPVEQGYMTRARHAAATGQSVSRPNYYIGPAPRKKTKGRKRALKNGAVNGTGHAKRAKHPERDDSRTIPETDVKEEV